MRRRWAALALLAGSFVMLLGISEAPAQRGLYKGGLVPTRYRTNEERRVTIGGGLPTNAVRKVRRQRNAP
jgi:hypothetical protein